MGGRGWSWGKVYKDKRQGNKVSESSNCVYCEYNALVDIMFCFFATGSFIGGLVIAVVAAGVVIC